MTKKRGRGAIIAVVIVALVVFGTVLGAWAAVTNLFQAPSASPGKTVTIVIQDGESTQQIADDLYSKGLIRNTLAFRVWARIKGLDHTLQAGYYDFTTDMTVSQIVDKLQNGQPDEVHMSVVDGYRIEQIGQKANALGLANFNLQDFLNYTHHPDQFPDKDKYPMLQGVQSMEGVLYPDTYLIPLTYNTVQVIDMMLDEYKQAVQQNNLVAQAQQYQLTAYQMLILASIVQREASNTVDMGLIAGIYWNRIEKPSLDIGGAYLEADPTVQYARDTDTPPNDGKYWAPLGGGGRTVDPTSRWNTYVFTGWPPTPISSPNLYALKAAASPTSTNCYYFLTKPSDGRIVCAQTLAQFQQLEQQYLG